MANTAPRPLSSTRPKVILLRSSSNKEATTRLLLASRHMALLRRGLPTALPRQGSTARHPRSRLLRSTMAPQRRPRWATVHRKSLTGTPT